jgi:hypothetical protein
LAFEDDEGEKRPESQFIVPDDEDNVEYVGERERERRRP